MLGWHIELQSRIQIRVLFGCCFVEFSKRLQDKVYNRDLQDLTSVAGDVLVVLTAGVQDGGGQASPWHHRGTQSNTNMDPCGTSLMHNPSNKERANARKTKQNRSRGSYSWICRGRPRSSSGNWPSRRLIDHLAFWLLRSNNL